MAAALFFPFAIAAGGGASGLPASEEARAALCTALLEEKAWIKIHAAEALLAEGLESPVRTAVDKIPEDGSAEWPRVGLWRVLARLSSGEPERKVWLDKLEAAFLTPAAPMERLQALESLCKLRVRLEGSSLAALRTFQTTALERDRMLAHWGLALRGEAPAFGALVMGLEAEDPLARLRAAYALRLLGSPTLEIRGGLERALAAEKPGSASYPYLLSAAYVLCVESDRAELWRAELATLLTQGTGGDVLEAAQALNVRPGGAGLRDWPSLSERPRGDARIGQALAMHHALRQKER